MGGGNYQYAKPLLPSFPGQTADQGSFAPSARKCCHKRGFPSQNCIQFQGLPQAFSASPSLLFKLPPCPGLCSYPLIMIYVQPFASLVCLWNYFITGEGSRQSQRCFPCCFVQIKTACAGHGLLLAAISDPGCFPESLLNAPQHIY